MANQTITLHRVIKASPEKVFRAFTDETAYASWLPPYGFTCSVQQFEPRVGGRYQMTFTNFTTGNSHSFGGAFLEIEPDSLIKYSDRFDDPNLPDEMITTITFGKGAFGTELKIVQENVPVQIPAELCYLGWQESLEKLTKLVEPDIQDG